MSARGAASRLHHEEAGFVASFIVRTVIVFVLLIVAAYEIGQIVLADVRSSKAASSAAQAAANTYAATKSYQRAEAAAREEDATVEVTLPIKIGKDGEVTVTVSVTAKTLIVGKISFLKHFAERTSTSTQPPGS